MYQANCHVRIDWGYSPWMQRSEARMWRAEVWRRGAAIDREAPKAIGFAATVRFIYERPADQPVFFFYDRGWGDNPGDRGTWDICPIEGAWYNGQKRIHEVTRQAVWLLARHGGLAEDSYGGFKRRRIHDVTPRPEREWFFRFGDAIEAGHAAGVAFARAELAHDDAQREAAKRRRDARRRKTKRVTLMTSDASL